MAARMTQEKFIDKVDAALRLSFPGATIELEPYDRARVMGEIAWAGFRPGDAGANQRMLSKALRESLGSEAAKVVMLFTATPQQKRIRDEDRLAEEKSILSTAKRILQERRKKARMKASNGHNGHHASAPKKRKLTTHG